MPTLVDRVSALLEGGTENRVALDDNGYFGHFLGLTLRSGFQPIFSPTLRRTVGFEGLLRAEDADGRPVSPLTVFSAANSAEETVHLDRTCRVLHVHNFVQRAVGRPWLFLNVNPRVVVDGRFYGSFFSRLLESAGIEPQRIVVEILESAIRDEALLADTVGYYKELGCLVAIDDFGSGQSNFDRVLRLEPDLVKIDRGLVGHARVNPRARRLLPNLVAMLHEAGCLVVLEGPEEEEDAVLALDCGADFVQGFYFGRPSSDRVLPVHPAHRFEHVAERARLYHAERHADREAELQPYRQAFLRSARAYSAGQPLADACAGLLHLARTLHCYALDDQGRQVSEDLFDDGIAGDPRYAPLLDTAEADWSRKPYFRQAVAEPALIHITRPYLSATEAHLCVTLSTAVEREGALHVLCAKLAWEDRL